MFPLPTTFLESAMINTTGLPIILGNVT
jgi:hypothetical protein